MRRAWFCDGCGKEHQAKAGAKACEEKHEPFIRAPVSSGLPEIEISGEFILFHPEHGDIVIEIASLIESIDMNAAGPVWIARFHDDEQRVEAEAT